MRWCVFVALAGVLGGCDLVFLEPPCSVEACRAAGGECGATKICELTCAAAGTCTCPRNQSCLIDVRAQDVIVDCGDAIDCTVRCLGDATGNGYCERSEVRCGRGRCDVNCTAEQFSCVDFSLTCGRGPCSLTCALLGSCQGGSSVQCGLAEECTTTCRRDTCGSLNVACEQTAACTVDCDPGSNNTCNNATFMCQQAQSCDLDCAGRPGCMVL